MRKIFTILLVFAVAVAFAKSADKVKSKKGDILITDAAGGGKTVCQAGFNDVMTIVKKQDFHTLVRAACQGWVNNADIETVLAGSNSRSINLETVDISSWIDSPSSVFVLEMETQGLGEIEISRNFNDFLTNTLDREQTEMRNQEN